MASGKIKGITVEIGGDTTKLGDAIKQSESKTASLQSELKEVNKLLKFDSANPQLLAQKQEILTRAIGETKEKLDTLKEAQAQVEKQFKNGDIGEDQYRAFQRELTKTEQDLEGFEKALKKTETQIEDTGDEAKSSSGDFTIMKGALADLVSNVVQGAVSAIGDLIGSLFELSEATEEYRTMQSKLAGSAETFGYSFEFANDKYKEFYTYLADDQASTNAITNLMGIGAETETVSALAEGATAVWASYGDSIPIEGLTEAINETITVGKVTGGMADTINWAKNANEGLKNALSGNKEAQKAYNDAIKEGLPVEDAFNEALAKVTDEQERADIVAKFLNETYGDSKKTYDELNGSILDAHEAELKLKDSQAQLGQAVEPLNTAFTNLKTKALEALLPIVEKVAEKFLDLLTWFKEHPTATKVLTAVVIALATAFGVLAGALAIQGIISGVTKAIALLNGTLLANPIVLIIALIAGLVAGFIYLWNNCDEFREFWINLWDKIKSVFTTVWDAIGNFITKTIPKFFKKAINTASNFVTKIIDYAKKLPGKIYDSIKNTVDKVKTWGTNVIKAGKDKMGSFITEVYNKVKNIPSKIYNGIKDAITKVKNWGSNIISAGKDKIGSFVSGIIDKVKTVPSKIYEKIKGAVDKVKTWGSNMVSKAKSGMTKVVTTVSSTLKSIPGKIKSIGGDIVSGLWKGIGNKVSWLKGKIKGFVGDVTGWLKNFFKIKSPSQLMRDEIGRYISEGIGVGIEENENAPIDALETMGNNIVDSAKNINGVTVGRQITNTFAPTTTTDGSVKELVDLVSDYFPKLISASEKAIVLDDNTLIGKTINKIDEKLALNYTMKARGI